MLDSRYLLVNVVAHRARQLSIESELTHEPLEEKPVTLAIREVAAGSAQGHARRQIQTLIERRRPAPCAFIRCKRKAPLPGADSPYQGEMSRRDKRGRDAVSRRLTERLPQI